MNCIGVDDLAIENIEVKIADSDNGLIVSFYGEMDMQDPDSSFLPYFEKINNCVVEKSIKKVQLDFRNLNFLNSSGIKILIKWLQMALVLPEDKVYKFEILANSMIPWQGNSLKLLTMLSPTLIEIKMI